MFTFLSYGYAVHARKEVKASSEEIAQHTHQVQDHEAEQLTLYTKVEELASQPDLFDEPNTQEEFVDLVQRQLHCCAQTKGSEVMENDCATTHSPIFSLDLVSTCRPNRSPKPGGHLCCSACRSPFQFYDKLQCIAMAKLDDDPNRLSEIADVLLTIHRCEHRSYRYMAHVMLAAQQAHHMKLAIVQMDSSTAYMVYDFKQKFLAKGFREGGDSYYGKKGMLWWGAGVYIKPETEEEAVSTEVQNQLYVESDYTSDKERLQQLMKSTEKDDIQAEEMGVLEQEEDENDMVEEEKRMN